MAEVKRLEIDLGDFAQDSFVEWFVANQPDEADAVLDELASIPYVEFLESHEDYASQFVEYLVNSRVSLNQNNIEEIVVGNYKEYCDNYTFAKILSRVLARVIREEFGISGYVPPRFTTFIISHLREGIENLNKRLPRERSDKSVSSRSIKDSCLICREVENLTNLFVEIKYRALEEEPKQENIGSWHERVEFLRKKQIIGHKRLIEFENMLKGDDEDKGLCDVLDDIRKIRNKVAHPQGLLKDDLVQLVNLASYLLSRLEAFLPLCSRIVSVEKSSSGLLRVGIYSEADRQRSKPHMFFVRNDHPHIKDKKLDELINSDCIVLPFRIIKSRYVLDSHPTLLLRDKEIVNQLHATLKTERKVVIYYTEVAFDKLIETFALEEQEE